MSAEDIRSGSFSGLPIETRFGAGTLGQLGDVLKRDGIERLMVITGKTLAADQAVIDRVSDAAGGRIAGVFSGTEAHVPRETVLAASERARELRADGLLSLGGSTQSDTAKAAAWALAENITEPDGFEAYAIRFEYPATRVVPRITGKALPIYGAPTTLSAGEFTNIAGITDRAHGHKQVYQDRQIALRSVFLDPELTLATPQWLWLSSGVKAIDHCVEAFLSTRAQPYTDALAAQALGALLANLPLTRTQPANLAARLECQIAAWLSVAGLTNVSLGLSHGMGHQLGAISGVSHGHTACVVLRHVIAFNRPATRERQERLIALARLFGGLDGGDETLADAILHLVRDQLQLPWRLRDVGAERRDFPKIAAATMGDSLIATNPRPVTAQDEIIELLEAAW